MKRIDISTHKPNFIGCWDLENKTLCDEIVTFFQSNKNLYKEGTTTLGKNIEAKKFFEKILTLDPNNLDTAHGYGVLLLKLNQHSKGLNYIRKGTSFIRFAPGDCKII